MAPAILPANLGPTPGTELARDRQTWKGCFGWILSLRNVHQTRKDNRDDPSLPTQDSMKTLAIGMMFLLSVPLRAGIVRQRLSSRSESSACVPVTLTSCGSSVTTSFGSTNCYSQGGDRADYFDFKVTRGQLIVLTVRELDATLKSPEVYLLSPSYDPQFTPGLLGGASQTIQYRATSDGTWDIAVFFDPSSSGRYSVSTGCYTAPDYSNVHTSCIAQVLVCNQKLDWYLGYESCWRDENHSSSGQYAWAIFAEPSATDATAKLSSNEFNPVVQLYRVSTGQQEVTGTGSRGSYPASFNFHSDSAAQYELVVESLGSYLSGEYVLEASCPTVAACVSPTVSALAPATTPVGTSVTLGAQVTGGDGPFTYRWFDDADPFSTLATTASFITPRLSRTTTYRVEVTGKCGTASTQTTVTVIQPRRRAARH